MKKKETVYAVLYYVILPVLIAAVLLTMFFLVTVGYPKDVLRSGYQSVIQDKYDQLCNTPSPKIIVLGGSSAGFGLDEALLSEETGYSVVNMGLHAGFSQLFNTEIAKANIGEGDIVVMAHEYELTDLYAFNRIGVDNVMHGIDSKLEMYGILPLSQWPAVIGYLPTFCEKKAVYVPWEGFYSREAFDENAHMISKREFALMNYHEDIDAYKYVDLKDAEIPPENIKYLRDFRDYVRDRGAMICFTAPPLYEEAKYSDDESFLAYAAMVEEETGIAFISNPLDYIFPAEYIFDTIYHCSSLGEIKRTELLADDINAFLNRS